jgi:hypothetical protein
VARLAELVIRSLAGLHPAVWWIARRLEIEREVACDDHAVNVTGAPREFARCLTRLAEVPRGAGNPVLVPGALAASQLTTRVMRLLDPRRTTSTRRCRALLTAASVTLTIGTTLLAQIELVAVPPPAVPRIPATRTTDTALPARRDVPEPRPVPAVESASDKRARGGEPDPPAASPAPVPRPAMHVNRDASTMVETAPLVRIDRRVWPDTMLPALSSATTRDAGIVSPSTSGPSASADDETPWGAAADAGIAIGRGSKKAGEAAADGGVALGEGSQKAGEAIGGAGTSFGKGTQKAAVATAGFFSRMGRRIAGGS